MVRFLAPRPARNHGEDQWAVVVFRPTHLGMRRSRHWFATRFAAWVFVERSCEEIRLARADVPQIDA